jgi:chaperonin GroEL
VGVQIIQNALRVPMKTIASNAGVEGAVIVGKVLEMADPAQVREGGGSRLLARA